MLNSLMYTTTELYNIGDVIRPQLTLSVLKTLRSLKICKIPPTHRGSRGGKRKRKKPMDVNAASSIRSYSQSIPQCKCCLLNVRSVNNKAALISDLIVDNAYDIVGLTETWLSSEGCESILGELTPDGYSIHHIPRLSGRGGGLALIYRSTLKLTPATDNTADTFENLEVLIKDEHKLIRFLLIYRPPPSARNKLTIPKFMEEFALLLDRQTLTPGELILLGDFNFHFENCNDPSTSQLLSILESRNFTQHVQEATHNKGHLLDLVITRNSEQLVSNVSVHYPMISDHHSIQFTMSLKRPLALKKTIQFRKYKAIDIEALKHDIRKAGISTSLESSLDNLVKQYDDVLTSILDDHAPLKSRVITIRPNTAWYNEEIDLAKKHRRHCEKIWRRTKLMVHKEAYKEQCYKVSQLIKSAKMSYYSTLVDDNAGDQKTLQKLVDKLLNVNQESPLPSGKSNIDLANHFLDFFTSKIRKIHECLLDNNLHPQVNEQLTQKVNLPLFTFYPASQGEVQKTIMGSANKSCHLDPMPTWLIKALISELLPCVTAIVNISLSTGYVASMLKRAVITPVLKKPSLDSELCKNFRPVSNLSFVSKVIEKVVASRIKEHLENNNLMEEYQSAYRQFHSTETALLKVQDDILKALNQGLCIPLVLLDLSAAFDTVDHSILINRLHADLGISGKALEWVTSYLKDRKQCIKIRDSQSESQDLTCGVPQGSVLGPILFILYMIPIGRLLRSHGMKYHIYADDIQVYLSCHPDDLPNAVTRLESCVNDIKTWMGTNMLKLNGDKTEFMVIRSKRGNMRVQTPNFIIGDSIIQPSVSVRNIGITFDQHMSGVCHITNICRSLYFNIRKIGRIRKYLTNEATKLLVHASVTSRLDYGNSLLYGLPETQIKRLQKAQNTAARLILRVSPRESISCTLKELHWLPVRERISYKILLLTFKALIGQAPSYLQQLVSKKPCTRSLRGNQGMLQHPPDTRKSLKSCGDRTYSAAAPSLWNKLPEELRQSPGVILADTFKSKLKTLLFQSAFH